MGEACSHLSEEERRVIQIEIGNGAGIRGIGLMPVRNASTVGREAKRNTWFPSDENGSCRPCRPKRLKTGPGRVDAASPAPRGRMAGLRLVAAARQRQAARPVPRRPRHARVPGDRLPLDNPEFAMISA